MTLLTHRRAWTAAFSALAVLFGVCPLGHAADAPGVTYTSTVSEVRLTFFVADAQNRSVQSLRREDFAIVDNEGVIREFRSFDRASETRVNLAVLIDCSESVSRKLQKETDSALRLISQAPWAADDTLSMIAFGGMAARLVCSGHCRDSFTAGTICPSQSAGATPLFDALQLASGVLQHTQRPEARSVIILFSDGADTISRASLRDAQESLAANNIQAYTVDLNGSARPSSGTAILQNLAAMSGGRYLTFDKGAPQVLDAVVDDLHSGFVVTYALPKPVADFHTVHIFPTNNLNLQFRCRQGYYDRRQDR